MKEIEKDMKLVQALSDLGASLMEARDEHKRSECKEEDCATSILLEAGIHATGLASAVALTGGVNNPFFTIALGVAKGLAAAKQYDDPEILSRLFLALCQASDLVKDAVVERLKETGKALVEVQNGTVH